MKRYVARGNTIGFEGDDSLGPFYRYFYSTDLSSALQEANENYIEMFKGGVLEEFLGISGKYNLCNLAVKEVGKNHEWHYLWRKVEERTPNNLDTLLLNIFNQIKK
ncbi:MAG: hypothetical protein WC867_03485 [Candidatus Pacearchaeota archaeon]|jgi:hypothetical protein